jgi:hypothetical protein
VRKLKELFAKELGLQEEDAVNLKLFVNGEEILDDKLVLKDNIRTLKLRPLWV